MASNAELDEVDEWLARNPRGIADRAERRARLNVVQAAADELADSEYQRYVGLWTRAPAEAEAMERSGILSFLARRRAHALREIEAARVTRGVLAWHFYNMGYVFKTADACFGIDLHGRGLEVLADRIDFLLITHSHGDHVTPALLRAMQERGKPVVSNWCEYGTRLSAPAQLSFGSVNVRVSIGDHGLNDPARTNDMLLYEIEAGGAVIYHIGDNANLDKMAPTRPVDWYIFHISVGLPVVESIRKVDARLTLASHVLELGHSRFPPHAWRWSYDFAYERIASIPADRAEVPVWGERYEVPGTEWSGG